MTFIKQVLNLMDVLKLFVLSDANLHKNYDNNNFKLSRPNSLNNASYDKILPLVKGLSVT
jgi:hypothetical protein